MGKAGQSFENLKFRAMWSRSEKMDGITLLYDIPNTKVGAFLREYRFDEIPQLFNVIKGEMSFVGPRRDLP